MCVDSTFNWINAKLNNPIKTHQKAGTSPLIKCGVQEGINVCMKSSHVRRETKAAGVSALATNVTVPAKV